MRPVRTAPYRPLGRRRGRLAGTKHAPGDTDQTRMSDQELSLADQATSSMDQMTSDADQAASAASRQASQLDQQGADLEQRASDADQAAADLDVDAGPPQSPSQIAASDDSRALRLGATADRVSAAANRAAADDTRAQYEADRDRASTERDTQSDDRDAVAEFRDETSAALDRLTTLATAPGEPDQRDALRRAAAQSRAAAASDRRAAARARARDLIQQAEVALEISRDADRMFEEEVAREDEANDRRAKVRVLLPGAIARNELRLAYQPLYALSSGAVVGFEALLRWTSPTLGFVPPDEFIPVAEDTGLIVPIGEWVLATALHSLAEWRALAPDGEFTVAVNVAPEQLLVGVFASQVSALLSAAGVPPEALTLEITERTLVSDEPALRCAMDRLRATGVRLSVDDFGTGFSSLGRLASFPLDELKIDRIFIDGLGDDRRQRALVTGIISMSTALDLHVVAEGIETQAQHDLLVELGCELGQGYHLNRPLECDAIARLIGARDATSGHAQAA